MGLLGVAVWDIEHRQPLLVRLVRGGLGTEQTRDVLIKFSNHCDSLQGKAGSPEEVTAKWDPPPRVSYKVVASKIRVIVLWNEIEPAADVAADAARAVALVGDSVQKNSEALLRPEIDDKYYTEVYFAVGEALLLGEVEDAFLDDSDKQKKGIRSFLGISRTKDAPKSRAPEPKPQATRQTTTSKQPAVAAETSNEADEKKAGGAKRLLPFLGRSKSKKESAVEPSPPQAASQAAPRTSARSSDVVPEPAPAPIVVAEPEIGDADDEAIQPPKGSFLDSSSDEDVFGMGDAGRPQQVEPPQVEPPRFEPAPQNGGDLSAPMNALDIRPPPERPPQNMPTRRQLLGGVTEAMTAGDFPTALAMSRDAIRAGPPDPDLAPSVFYSFALELILRIQAAERQPDGQKNLLGIAFLSSALVDLPLMPRHRAGARSMAAQKHLTAGNFGLAADYAENALQDAEPDQRPGLQRTIAFAGQKGRANVRVPASSRLCFKKFSPLGSPYLGCSVCPAQFSLQSGLQEGMDCAYCPFGRLSLRQ